MALATATRLPFRATASSRRRSSIWSITIETASAQGVAAIAAGALLSPALVARGRNCRGGGNLLQTSLSAEGKVSGVCLLERLQLIEHLGERRPFELGDFRLEVLCELGQRLAGAKHREHLGEVVEDGGRARVHAKRGAHHGAALLRAHRTVEVTQRLF